ncbi:MAG: hypothetical protein R2737_04390 [Candidatus Nanopelagicales bacterium]
MTRTTTTRRAFAATVAVGLAAGLLAAASPALAKPNGPKPHKPPKPVRNTVAVVTSATPCPAALSSSGGVTSRVVVRDDKTAVLRIRGTQGDDVIVAAPAPLPEGVTLVQVVIHGYRGNDTICGLDSVPNRIYGLGGNDAIYGGSKVDALFGGSGDDSIWGNGDADKVVTGAGKDTVDVFAGSRVNGKVYPLPTP